MQKSIYETPTQITNNNFVPHSDRFKESFAHYAFEFLIDFFLAVFLGICVNTIANYLGKKLGLSFIVKFIIQLFLIIIVLYMLKIDSIRYLRSWRGQTSYGIVFVSVFLAVQANIIRFLENIWLEDENRVGIFDSKI